MDLLCSLAENKINLLNLSVISKLVENKLVHWATVYIFYVFIKLIMLTLGVFTW